MARSDPRFSTWRYFRFDVPPEELPGALKTFHARGFYGLNLTVPHKVIAFSEVAEIDPAALPIGAVNTLVRTDRGWKGFNTDGYGLASGLRETLGLDLAGAPVLLLGAGGAARGAAVECLQRGCAGLWIANRTQSNLALLIDALRPLAGKISVAGIDPLSAAGAALPSGLIVINATSAGLRGDDAVPFDLERLVRPRGVYDMIYNPPRTTLLARAEALGIPAANGLSMLVHQGARALQHWSQNDVPVAAMRAAAEAAMAH
jgi:shikimate dehydrogenase